MIAWGTFSDAAFFEQGYQNWLAMERAEDWWPTHTRDAYIRAMRVRFEWMDKRVNPSKHAIKKIEAALALQHHDHIRRYFRVKGGRDEMKVLR